MQGKLYAEKSTIFISNSVYTAVLMYPDVFHNQQWTCTDMHTVSLYFFKPALIDFLLGHFEAVETSYNHTDLSSPSRLAAKCTTMFTS